ncbi:MAG: hypothetical protein DWH91_16135 [Planctomycetota bacterium]|nr:MAG: hypothetical protein DWH91_16135 [Planctomycetota bacterium]
MPSPTALEGTMDRKTTAPKLVLEAVRSSFDLPVYPLALGRHMVGSSSECDIVIPVEGVAEQHCMIIVGTSRTIVKALSPLTWINDGPITEAVLPITSRLILGPVEMHLRRPEVSEWLEATEHRAADPKPTAPPAVSPPVKQYQPPRINELLDQARTHLQQTRTESWSLESPRRVEDAAPRSEKPVVLPPALSPVTPVSTATSELADRELAIRERSRSLDYLGTELARREAQLISTEQRLTERDLLLRQQETASDERLRNAEQREAIARNTAQQEAEESLRLTTRNQEAQQLAEKLERRWQEIEERAGQLDQQQQALVQREQSLEERGKAMAAATRVPPVSLDSRPTRDEDELVQREQRITRREATLASSLDALNATQQQVAEESAQLEVRFQQLAQRERATHQAQTELQQQTRKFEASRREIDSAMNELREWQQTATSVESDLAAREQTLSEREAVVSRQSDELSQRAARLESRHAELVTGERELRHLRSEFDIQDEALKQQYSQLQLDRTAMRSAQSKAQILEGTLRQREEALALREANLELQQESLAAEARQFAEKPDERTSDATSQRIAELDQREQQLVARQAEQDATMQAITALQVALRQEKAEWEQSRLAVASETASRDTAQAEAMALAASQQRLALEELKAELKAEQARLLNQSQELAAAQAELESERYRWETDQALAMQAASQNPGEPLAPPPDERESLQQMSRDLEQEYAQLRAEQAEYRHRMADLASLQAECEALRKESAEERDTYLIERQAVITERQTMGDRERAVQKLESEAEKQRSEMAVLREELDVERTRIERQRQSLTEDWEALRLEHVELDAQREELRSLVDQLSTDQPEAALSRSAPSSLTETSEIEEPATLDEETAAEFPPASAMDQDVLDDPELEAANDETDLEPELSDELAGFASFSSIDDSSDEEIPPEVASLLGFPLKKADSSKAITASPAPAAKASGPQHEGTRLQDLLRRPLASLIDQAAAETVAVEQYEVVDETDAQWEVVDDVTAPSTDTRVSKQSLDSKPGSKTRDEEGAIRSRLSEMFGINLGGGSPSSSNLEESEPELPDHSVEKAASLFTRDTSRPPSPPPAPVSTPEPISESDDPVAAYMEQLLARTRKVQHTPSPNPPALPKPEPAVEVEPDEPEMEAFDDESVEEPVPMPEPVLPESQAPFKKAVPQNREALRANLDSFRTIANTKARADLAVSEIKRLRVTVQVKKILLVVCGTVTATMTVMQLFGKGDLFVEILGAGVATAFLGGDVLRTTLRLRKLQTVAQVDDDFDEADSQEEA